jgi:hypothetical protein
MYLRPPVTGGPVIPQATGSLFVAFYDSQGYGGGILSCLHTGTFCFHLGLFVVYLTTLSVAHTIWS